MKVAILGLAGDPPHNGHKSIMGVVSKFVDEVWLMPCYFHKFKKPIATPEQRLAMCRMLGKTSDYEIQHKFYGYTIDIVNSLKRDFPEHEFSIVIGQDNANSIQYWVKWQELIAGNRFIVVPRGDRASSEWYLNAPHIFVHDFMPQEYSSTEIRRLIKAKNYTEAAAHLDPDVLKYIMENELYAAITE